MQVGPAWPEKGCHVGGPTTTLVDQEFFLSVLNTLSPCGIYTPIPGKRHDPHAGVEERFLRRLFYFWGISSLVLSEALTDAVAGRPTGEGG